VDCEGASQDGVVIATPQRYACKRIGSVRYFTYGKALLVTIDVAFLELKSTGAAMKESIGTFRTIIQGQGSSSAVAA
jgi:hypothetical protein